MGEGTKASRSTTIRDFLIFQLKLVVDGAKDVAVFNLSVLALLLDLLSGRGTKRRLFYSVLELSERFDLWLNLHSVTPGLGETDDGLFGASRAGSPTFLGRLEEILRGGDEPLGRRRGREEGGGEKGRAAA